MADLVERILDRARFPVDTWGCEACAAAFDALSGQPEACPECGTPKVRRLGHHERCRIILGRLRSPLLMQALAMTEDDLRALAATRGLDASETAALLTFARMVKDVRALAAERVDG